MKQWFEGLRNQLFAGERAVNAGARAVDVSASSAAATPVGVEQHAPSEVPKPEADPEAVAVPEPLAKSVVVDSLATATTAEALRLRQLVEYWNKSQSGAGLALFLQGGYGSGRRAAARTEARRQGRELHEADVAAALRDPNNWQDVIDGCFRKAAGDGVLLYWSHTELLLDSHESVWKWAALIQTAQNYPQVTFLASDVPGSLPQGLSSVNFYRVCFPYPGYDDRVQIWLHELQRLQGTDVQPGVAAVARLLAGSFRFTAGQICDAINEARRLAVQRNPECPVLTLDDLQSGCRLQAGSRLNALGRRISPTTESDEPDPWSRLVLPRSQKRRLLDLGQRIRSHSDVSSKLMNGRRLGLQGGQVAMFTGPSGTGKTMAAECLAGATGRDLFKIDLSVIVSKFIGETEKNLGRLFDEAEESNAIIFFDEADAIFGKRGDVREARDRWANLEVNYLLQRMDDHSGVVILATNLQQNIDAAFRRRIQIVVDFPLPDAQNRKHIFREIFRRFDRTQVATPGEEQINVLAERFQLTGAGIRNVVIDAAFRANAESRDTNSSGRVSAPECSLLDINLKSLVVAIGREYEKSGTPVTEEEFGEQFYQWFQEEVRGTSW